MVPPSDGRSAPLKVNQNTCLHEPVKAHHRSRNAFLCYLVFMWTPNKLSGWLLRMSSPRLQHKTTALMQVPEEAAEVLVAERVRCPRYNDNY